MTRKKISAQTFDEIESLFNKAICSDTKERGKEYLQQLKFIRNSMTNDIKPYIINIFSELICFTSDATGRVRNKPHYVKNACDALIKLKMLGVD